MTDTDEITRLRAEVERLGRNLDVERGATQAAVRLHGEVLAENDRLREALIVWRNAYKTGRDEPLVQAYEHSEALAAQPAPGKENR